MMFESRLLTRATTKLLTILFGVLGLRYCYMLEGVWYIYDWDTGLSILIYQGSSTGSARLSFTR